MSDDENEKPCVSFFAKRASLAPKKTPEELKAAEELVKKIEAETMPVSIDAESSGNKPGSSGKKGRKKKFPLRSSECSQGDSSSFDKTSEPSKRPLSPTAMKDKVLVDQEIEQVRLSAAAKRRIKKLKEAQQFDLFDIEAKNAAVFEGNPFKRPDLDLAEQLPVVEEEKIFHVTVTYLSKVARFKTSENEKFYKVFQDVGDFFQLNPAEFLLCLNDKNISVTDTPKSLGMSELDILECIPYKPDLPSTSALDDDTLTVTFQSNDSKSKVDLVVNRMDKMKDIMEQYAKKRNMPLSDFTFEFDGIKLVGSETPAELDMETGDCIDAMVFMPLPQCSRASDNRPIIDQPPGDQPKDKDDYFSVYIDDFVFVDSDDSDVIALD